MAFISVKVEGMKYQSPCKGRFCAKVGSELVGWLSEEVQTRGFMDERSFIQNSGSNVVRYKKDVNDKSLDKSG